MHAALEWTPVIESSETCIVSLSTPISSRIQCHCVTRRDACESDNVILPGKLYHMVNQFASHAQLTFAPLYDKDSIAK